MAVPSLSKDMIRTTARAARRSYAEALDTASRERIEAALAEMVLPHLLGTRVVAAYHPMRDEISPYPLLARLDAGQQAVLPWFADRGSRMIFRKAPATEVGPWGMLQPSADAAPLPPDAVVLPLVRADRLGTRIGMGKGHYDRALAHLREAGRVLAIGIAWDVQIADEPLPTEAWDKPLDAQATPSEWIDSRAHRAAERAAQ
jgi:5-formyltetrahydrofolate cyclo-ligase